jgi:hypothetical protein
MVKKASGSDKSLSPEDDGLVATIMLGWCLIYNLVKKTRPEMYAQKLLKATSSQRRPAETRLMFDLVREESNTLLSPVEYNDKLARELLDQSVNDLEDIGIASEDGDNMRILSPTNMNFVLETLVDLGVLDSITGRNAIKRELHSRPGRSGSDLKDTFEERFHGRPSAYKKTSIIKKLQKLMTNKKACELFYTALKNSGILYNYEQFCLASFYIALKRSRKVDASKNDSIAQRILKATGGTGIAESKIRSLQNELMKYSDEQLKQLAAGAAEVSMERRKDDAYFLLGLFRM